MSPPARIETPLIGTGLPAYERGPLNGLFAFITPVLEKFAMAGAGFVVVVYVVTHMLWNLQDFAGPIMLVNGLPGEQV